MVPVKKVFEAETPSLDPQPGMRNRDHPIFSTELIMLIMNFPHSPSGAYSPSFTCKSFRGNVCACVVA